MHISDSTTTPRISRPDTAHRTAIVLGILGLLILVLIIFSQVVLAINPYRQAAEQVTTLLQSAPDLETRLDYASLTPSRLQGMINPMVAESITTDLDPSAEEFLIASLSSSGVRVTEVRTFASMLEDVAQEILALQDVLNETEQAVKLKSVLYRIRQQPDAITTTSLSQVYELTPLMIEDLNAMRRRLLSLSNTMRLITDNAQLEPLTEALGDLATAENTSLGAGQAYINSYNAWKTLPDACDSLEIQFAGTVSILDDIFTAVNAARLQDRRMGYVLWEPTAVWVDSNLTLMVVAAIGFLAAAVIAYSRRQIPIAHPESDNKKPEDFLSRIVASGLIPTRPVPPKKQNPVSPPPKPASEMIPTRPVKRSRPGESVNPRIVVMRADGRRETKPLSIDKAFRIGSDPRNPVHIEDPESGYIEIWVRRARANFFIEVMFSETPVLINRQPFTGARLLHNGDLIQVCSVNLIFFEE